MMKVIDEAKLDKLIDLTMAFKDRESDYQDILEARVDVVKSIDDYKGFMIGDIVYGAVFMRQDEAEMLKHKIYCMFGCLGYEVKEVEK
jgi:hypothetical protein